jgi:dihydrofolate reductase
MKIKSLAFVATSLDGFIAKEDDSLDWLNEANKRVSKGEDCGFNKFIESIDCLVMGRVSFEKVLTFSQWPYSEMKVIVLSSKKIEIPVKLQKTVSCSALSPPDLIKKLTIDRAKKIYVDGGVTIQKFLLHNLLDEITITIIPVLLGRGKPLFAGINREIKLELVSSKAFDFGFVQNRYKICK